MMWLWMGLLTFDQLFIGFHILDGFGVTMKRPERIALSVLTGMIASSLLIIFLDLTGLTLNGFFLAVTHVFVTLALLILRRKKINQLIDLFRLPDKQPSLYFWLTLLLFTILILPSIWRCYYLPVTPYDSVVGMDLVAKYAVREGSIHSSIFQFETIGRTQNQLFYAPFTTLMQIIYRLIGFPFGKMWLTIIFLAFLFVFYRWMAEKLHPILAGLMTIFLIATSEFYAYSFLLQTDFTNAIFFVIGIVFWESALHGRNVGKMGLASLFLGAAVWARSETLVFVGLLVLMTILIQWTRDRRLDIRIPLTLIAGPVFFFVLWNIIYLYVILPYRPENLIHLGWSDPGELGTIVAAMTTQIMEPYWGVTILLFGTGVFLNLLFFRSIQPVVYIIVLIAMFIAFALIIHHFPAANVPYTFRRGFLKFIPLFFIFLSRTRLFHWLSQKLIKFT